jgi:hypothetical protein
MLMESEAFLIACMASGAALDAESFADWPAHPTVTAEDSNTIVKSFMQRSFFIIAWTPVGVYWQEFYVFIDCRL